MNVVTTRAIAQAMGGSTQPIFSQFATLDDVRVAVLDKAISSFSSKHHQDFNDPDALLLISKHLIETVTENPHLLHSLSLNTMLGTSETYQEGKTKLLHQLMDVHQLTEKNANMALTWSFSVKPLGSFLQRIMNSLKTRRCSTAFWIRSITLF